MTRLTRLFLVQEYSDNEKESVKRFEMTSEVKTSHSNRENEDPCCGNTSSSPKPEKPNTSAESDQSIKSERGNTKNEKPREIPPKFSKNRALHRSRKTQKVISFGEDSQQMRLFEDCLLFKVMYPLFICMKCTGIFFIRKTRYPGRGIRTWLKNCTSNQAYCIFIICLLMLNFVRFFFAFREVEDFGHVLFFKFLVALFCYEAVSRALLAYIACWRKKDGLAEFFIRLEQICYSDCIIPYEVSLKRSMRTFLVLTFVISCSNAAVIAYGMLGPPEVQELFTIYLVPIPTDLDGILAFKIFLALIDFVNGMVAILSLSFFSMVCFILYREFEYLNRTFRVKLQDDGTFTDDIEKFRIKHQDRCKLVERADGIFKYYIANSYLTNIPLLCLLLYGTVYSEGEDDFSYRFISAFRLAYVLLQMVVLSVIATMINSQAHAPLADIYSIKVHDGIRSRQMEMGGMVLTYFFLLLQFRSPQMSVVCHCFSNNNTNFTIPGEEL